MKIFEAESKKLPPLGVLILLSVIFPGAGHLAIKHNVKGSIFIGASAILFIAFFYYLAFIMGSVQTALMAGQEPQITDELIENAKAIAYIMGGGFSIWIAALLDVIIIGRRINR